MTDTPAVAPPHVKVTWRIGLEVLLAIVALIALWSYISAREAKVKAEATQTADEKVIAQNEQQRKLNDQQIQLLAAQVEQLRADQVRQLAASQAQFSRAQTPDQSAALTALLLGLKTNEVKAGGTTTAPTIEAPVAKLQAYEQVCEECKIKLPSLTAQMAAVTSELAKEKSTNQLLASDIVQRTQERDQWKKAAKGGSFWQRFGRSLKYIAIGAGVGAAAVCGSGHCR